MLEVPPAEPDKARAHFEAKLSVETDPADVHADLEKGIDSFIIVDARSPSDFEACHVPTAYNLPCRRIDETTTSELPREKPIVVYCWGPGCNAATKGALRLAELGFSVKEMIGGLEYWRREGYPVEGTKGAAAPLYG